MQSQREGERNGINVYERECDFVASPPTGRVVLALGPNSAKNPFPRRHIESLASRLFLTCPDPADGRLLATGREEARTQNEVKEGKGNTSRGRVRETRDTSLLLKEKRWKKKSHVPVARTPLFISHVIQASINFYNGRGGHIIAAPKKRTSDTARMPEESQNCRANLPAGPVVDEGRRRNGGGGTL